jgi:hypothetical protein
MQILSCQHGNFRAWAPVSLIGDRTNAIGAKRLFHRWADKFEFPLRRGLGLAIGRLVP